MIADCEGTLLGTKLIVLFIVDEAVRLLVQEFLRGDTAEPRLFTISNPERSPLTAVCQYLSSLLLCDSPRLVLIFGREGHATTSEWEEKRPDQIRFLRRLVLLALSWVQRRHSDRLFDMPWALCALADPQASANRKNALIAEWDQTSACCLRPGLARKLKERGLDGAGLLLPKRLGFGPEPKVKSVKAIFIQYQYIH